MPIFLGVHKLSGEMNADQVKEGWEKYKQSAISKGLRPLGAVVSVEKGFAYCQTEAQSQDQVREAHQAVEIQLEDVVEVEKLD